MHAGRIASAVLIALALVAAAMLGVIWWRHGGGAPFPERKLGKPLLPESALEVVADLDLPPGNVAVSESGRIFFTFHPEGRPDIKVAELVDGKPVAYPDAAFQSEREDAPWFDTPLSLRIDRQNRLWVLDYGAHGTGTPRLVAFDLATNRLVHEVEFPSDVAGLGSMLNDFQVSPDGSRVYIADASIFRNRGAIVVYDVAARRARRLLDGHPSVQAKPYVTRVQGRDMVILGVFAVRPNVDSIALDRRGEWLYFAAVAADELYRVRRTDLDDESLSAEDLAGRVETFATKTESDGITTDLSDRVYLSDPGNDAVHAIGPDRKLVTLLATPRLRWPDGFSFGPDGWLYVTASSLHHVIFMGADHVRENAPYQIFRFRPGADAPPGH
jgi:sugar lactone lactonase YvrE